MERTHSRYVSAPVGNHRNDLEFVRRDAFHGERKPGPRSTISGFACVSGQSGDCEFLGQGELQVVARIWSSRIARVHVWALFPPPTESGLSGATERPASYSEVGLIGHYPPHLWDALESSLGDVGHGIRKVEKIEKIASRVGVSTIRQIRFWSSANTEFLQIPSCTRR